MNKIKVSQTLMRSLERIGSLEKELVTKSEKLAIHEFYMRAIEKLTRDERTDRCGDHGDGLAKDIYHAAVELEMEYHRDKPSTDSEVRPKNYEYPEMGG